MLAHTKVALPLVSPVSVSDVTDVAPKLDAPAVTVPKLAAPVAPLMLTVEVKPPRT